MEMVRAEGRVARREVDLHLLGVAAAAWGCCLWSRRPARLVRSLLLTQSGGAVRHVWEAPKRGTRCTRIVWIYEQVWALIAITAKVENPQSRRNAIISSMLYTGTEVPNRGATGNGKAANGWEDGGMGGRSRWGNCSL